MASSANSSAASSPSSTGSSSVRISPKQVATKFLRWYYPRMNETPDELIKFYKEESSFSHIDLSAGDDEEVRPVTGLAAIGRRIKELNLAGIDVKIGNVHAQHSIAGCVLLVVSGVVTKRGSTAKPFSQTFFMQGHGQGKDALFYVMNDIFVVHTTSPSPSAASTPKAVPAPVPAAAESAEQGQEQPAPPPEQATAAARNGGVEEKREVAENGEKPPAAAAEEGKAKGWGEKEGKTEEVKKATPAPAAKEEAEAEEAAPAPAAAAKAEGEKEGKKEVAKEAATPSAPAPSKAKPSWSAIVGLKAAAASEGGGAGEAAPAVPAAAREAPRPKPPAPAVAAATPAAPTQLSSRPASAASGVVAGGASPEAKARPPLRKDLEPSDHTRSLYLKYAEPSDYELKPEEVRVLMKSVSGGVRMLRCTVRLKHAFVEMENAETAQRILALAQSEPGRFIVGGGAVRLVVEAKKPPQNPPMQGGGGGGGMGSAGGTQGPRRGGGAGGRGAGGGRGKGPGGRGEGGRGRGERRERSEGAPAPRS